MSKLDINEIRKITDLENYITQYADIGMSDYVHTTRRAYAKEIVEHFEDLGFTVVSNDTDGVGVIIKISW